MSDPRTEQLDGSDLLDDNTSFIGRQLRVVRGSDVRTRRVEWWEPDLIPCSSLTLLAGREGLGKSTVACSWAARETNTGNTILYLHSEDSREHTVAPRLKAAGADMANVIFVDVATEYTDTGNVILPLDTAAIEHVIVEHNVTFMVLDAATSSMSSELSGRDDREVRRFLEPLTQLAARRNLVILGLVHFGKRDGNDTGKLILGSIAWSQVARSVLSLAKDNDSGELVLTNTKGNLAPRTRSVSLRLHSATVITDDGHAEVGAAQWLGDTDRDARELLAPPDPIGDDHDDRTAAEHWLADYLQQNGQTPAKTVKSDGAKEKISERTLKRAASKIGVIFESKGFPRTSHWSLPQSGQPTPYTGERGPTGPTGPDQAKQNGPTETKSQSGHTPVHGPTGGPTAISDSQAACVACSAELPDALLTVELCDVCTAALGYITRTVTNLTTARRQDILHACSSTDGSRDKLDQVLIFAVKSGRIGLDTIDGKRIYTLPAKAQQGRVGRCPGCGFGSFGGALCAQCRVNKTQTTTTERSAS
ncbi:AAA family ATPase [Antrihabitans sp. NCIMB 15449]|uniref:AAA family ATPase n=1 Tax=Antrihabitans spumae TaxID=3373370 RepID=A0ABW7JKP2_9NOCA